MALTSAAKSRVNGQTLQRSALSASMRSPEPKLPIAQNQFLMALLHE